MKIEEDIFGNQFVGRSRVISLALDYEALPPGAKDLLAAVLDSQVQVPLSEIFAEAIAEVNEEFWAKRLSQLTPLEWKVIEAKKAPGFRKAVEALLEEFQP